MKELFQIFIGVLLWVAFFLLIFSVLGGLFDFLVPLEDSIHRAVVALLILVVSGLVSLKAVNLLQSKMR